MKYTLRHVRRGFAARHSLAGGMRRALFFLREYFFPCGCAICGANLVSVNEAWYGLCEDCRESANTALADSGFGGEDERRNKRCDHCGRPLISEQGACLSCREESGRACDRVLVLFPYTGMFRKLLRAYKFGKNRALGHYFAEKITEALEWLTSELGPPSVSVETTESTIEWIFSADPVMVLSGLEFAKSQTDLVTQVEQFFNSIGGKVEREGFGIIKLTRQGIKASIAHGIGRTKAIAFKAVPEVIKNGKIIDFQINWKGRGYNTCVIDAPIIIGTAQYIVEVIIEQSQSGKNGYYLHEVELKEKAQGVFKTATKHSTPQVSQLIIAQKWMDVKQKNTNVKKNTKIKQKNTPLAIVPVPPRPGKFKKAGWDQVEYLARLLERGRGIAQVPVLRCLKRLPSKIQKELNREERMRNLRDRIVVTKKPPAAAVIIDDVMTTGSTLEVCATALKSGGAEKVYGICLFYD
jgi:predicted amidophosphoribosyltransferase